MPNPAANLANHDGQDIRYKVTTVDDNERRLKMSTLRVPDTRFTDTGNYTCHRSDARRLFANQYVFVSGNFYLIRLS